MTSTSMLTPTTATTSWRALLRVAAVFFLAVAFAIVAFTVGRTTAHVQHVTTVIARPSISVPAPGSPIDACRTALPPC
jgi:hypothetical protein